MWDDRVQCFLIRYYRRQEIIEVSLCVGGPPEQRRRTYRAPLAWSVPNLWHVVSTVLFPRNLWLRDRHVPGAVSFAVSAFVRAVYRSSLRFLASMLLDHAWSDYDYPGYLGAGGPLPAESVLKLELEHSYPSQSLAKSADQVIVNVFLSAHVRRTHCSFIGAFCICLVLKPPAQGIQLDSTLAISPEP